MKRKLGFGLIEMLVVVGAISALAAIGYPTVEKGFEKSKESNDITAMQSADSLITSAALSGKVIGGKPARDYTRDNPLYFDEGGNLVAAKPVGYGRGTAKSGGEIWSSCNDYAYDPSLDYTNAYIVCWYDSATRIAHVHWSEGDYSTGTPSATAPTYATFPTRETEKEEEKKDPTLPTVPDPKDDPVITEILDTGHPWPEMVDSPYWTTELKPGFEPVYNGHRYVYDGKVYVSGTTIGSFDYRQISPEKNWSWAFYKLTGRVLNSVDNLGLEPPDGQSYNVGDIVIENSAGYMTNYVDIHPGDMYAVYTLVDGEYVVTDCFVAKVPTTSAVAPTKEKFDSKLWSRICFKSECSVCGIDPPQYSHPDSTSGS